MTIEEYSQNDTEATQALQEAAHKLHVENLIQQAVDDGRKLVTVREISAIDDIPGADLIKVASVEGWKVVVKAGEFKPGDKCVFFEVDSFLQLSDPRFAFLEKNKITWQGIEGARLKTIRLRKQLSQGLALPLSLFPEIEEFIAEFHAAEDAGTHHHSFDFSDIRQMNFTGIVSVMKWEKVMSAQLAGQAKGNFPSFIRKSDQERAQNIGREIFGYEDEYVPMDTTNIPEDVLMDMVSRGDAVLQNGNEFLRVRPAQASRDTRYEITIKLDGSSMTIYRKGVGDDAVEGVCSRNLDLKLEGNEDNSFVKMALDGLLDVLRESGTNVAMQGELMGPGIQGNREGFTSNHFFVYNIFDIEAQEYLTPSERRDFISQMNIEAKRNSIPVAIEHVPVVAYDVTLSELGITNIDELLAFAIGKSLNNPVREGLVFKAADGRHQFKVISDLFLEQEK
jgi:RNA ligase (TIGR02306 family)